MNIDETAYAKGGDHVQMQSLTISPAPATPAAPVIGLLGPNSGQRLVAVTAALFGVLLTGITCSLLPIPVAGLPILMGAVGSVSVLLFVVPASPFAQPWAIIGGNLISACVGVAATHLIPYPVVAAAVAVSGAILAMSLARCLHPPGGASALAGVMGGPALAAAGWAYPAVLFVDCSILVLSGLLIHKLIGTRYPAPAAVAPAATAAVDVQRREAEAVALAQSEADQRAVLQDLTRRMTRLAARDLTTRIDADYPSDYRQLRVDFNTGIGTLDRAMDAISDRSADIRDAVGELAGASHTLARDTERSAMTLDQTSGALKDVTSQVARTADQAGEATRAVKTVEHETVAGGAVVRKAIDAMHDIRRSTGHIAEVTGLIDDLAFQTNLLALNAAIEAGHAGPAGKGFAVIAEEVRRLAQRSAHAAHEIKGLVATSTAQVAVGAELVDNTGGALTRIAHQVDAIGGLVSTIAGAARDQAAGLRTINDTIGGIAQTTQQTAANVQEHTAVTHELTTRTAALDRLLLAFRRDRDGDKSGSFHGGQAIAQSRETIAA